MLNNPITMPEYAKKKKGKLRGILHKGKGYSEDTWQKTISKHRQPSIYVETKVEKRKS